MPANTPTVQAPPVEPAPLATSSRSAPVARRLTAPDLQRFKEQSRRIVATTAYDATFARMLDDAGVDVLLVGDSLGMVIHGEPHTLHVTVEEMVYHTRAVVKGSQRAHVVTDMPFMSYQVSVEQALQNAGRLVQAGRAHSIKMEGGRETAPTVERIVQAGIPVMAHVGLMPQRVLAVGGFKTQGRTDESASRILDDARCMQEAGAYAVLVEGVPAEVARRVTDELQVPTVGIGAGPFCDGQVLVSYDLLGMNPDFSPRFVKRYANFFETGLRAAQAYCDEVRRGAFPSGADDQ